MVQLRRKIRHADTTDAQVVGSVGPRRRPRRLAVLPAGEDRSRSSAPLNAVLAARLGALLAVAPVEGEHLTEAGETYIGSSSGSWSRCWLRPRDW
ncbi:hypothetical protein ACFWEH_22410 [Streptomyces anulatus]|uniref:hypothetical protein n=1 Tax=Streptomyces TaxID=1883 RepID=UPI0011612BEE|nr:MULTISPECIES: hypothetical protein [Streptomyces]GGY68615.1 hypothetical protein GCM10010342_65630 [Streptomyces anulatus]